MNLLASYDEADKRLVAAEFAEIFIEDGNVDEVLSVLAALSPQIKNVFLARVARAPSSEPEWNRFQIIGAGMDAAARINAKVTWRLCVDQANPNVA